jgi:hypothetical protein
MAVCLRIGHATYVTRAFARALWWAALIPVAA